MGVWSWMLQDGLGSVRSFVDASLGVDAVQSYDPYGNPDSSYGAGFGFTGEQTDGNGQVYLRARYYNPSIGVFNDAVGELIFHNRYSYANGNPVNLVDPTGMQAVPNSQGFCPPGYANVSGNCAPYTVREPICAASSLLQARSAYDPSLSSDPALDLILTQIKAQCLLENNDTSLEKLAKLSDFVAQAYVNDPRGYMDLMSQVVIGTYAGAGAAVRSVFAGGCAGWGREERDCPDNDLFLDDSGFHLDFRDGRQQVYHFWGAVASVGVMQNIVDALYTLPLNFVLFQIGHEWVQGIFCNAGVPQPIGDSGSSWPDYALTNVAFHMGTRFALGDIKPTEVGMWIRNNVGENGPGRFGEFEGLRDLMSLPGGFTATCGC